jgi:pilus assembly protein CpaF
VADAVRAELVAEVAGGWEGPATPRPHLVAERVRVHHPLLDTASVASVVDVVLAHTGGLGPLHDYWSDDSVCEVMVNGGGEVWVERHGQLAPTGLQLDPVQVLGVAERVLAPLGLRVDRRNPVADARLPDGSRLHVVVPPVAVDGPLLTIRRFRVRPAALTSFCSPEVARLLRAVVAGRCNVLISGGTGAGKTTLLNAMAAGIGAHHRIVTIEDTAELRLPGDHVVRLEARVAGADAPLALGIGDLVRTALRMRPDRIVVGEVRGDEALAMLSAMNTGHEGSLSTVHANSPPDALRRLESMAVVAAGGLPLAAVRQHVAAAIDIVVQVARTGGQARTVVAVDEVMVGDGAGGPVGTMPLVDGGVVVAVPTRWRTAVPAW